jgi:hypothetical protein
MLRRDGAGTRDEDADVAGAEGLCGDTDRRREERAGRLIMPSPRLTVPCGVGAVG